jgi:hypothetical protein
VLGLLNRLRRRYELAEDDADRLATALFELSSRLSEEDRKQVELVLQRHTEAIRHREQPSA